MTNIDLIIGFSTSICYINSYKYKEDFWVSDFLKLLNKTNEFPIRGKIKYLTKSAENKYRDKKQFPLYIDNYGFDDFDEIEE